MFKTNEFILLPILCLSSLNVFGQFYTVLPEEKKDLHRPVIVGSENVSTNMENTHVLIKNHVAESPSIEEKEILKKMHQRKYLALPIDSLVITSEYGYRTDPIDGKKKFHKGIDMAADYNYIYSVMPGKVVKSGKNKGFGNFVEIESGDFRMIYAHLYQNLVDIKQKVEAGEPIGISGSTGRSTGEHLHFQMFFKDQTIDPKPILNFIESLADWSKNELSNMIETEINKTKK